MTHHLSEEQKSRWLLGQAHHEEDDHVRNCPICKSDLLSFRETMSTFQGVMRTWSEREGAWRLEDTPDVSSWQPRSHRRELRWILAAAAAGLLLIPAYWRLDISQREAPSAAVERNDDVRLMEAVTAHLARPISAPMERVIALLPQQSLAIEANEREEIR